MHIVSDMVVPPEVEREMSTMHENEETEALEYMQNNFFFWVGTQTFIKNKKTINLKTFGIIKRNIQLKHSKS